MNLYAVGRIVGCSGIKGFVKLLPTSQTPRRFEKLHNVCVGPSPDDHRQYAVESVDVKAKGVLIRFAGVDSRSSAEALVGNMVFVEESEAQAPEPGSYFTHDIVGCEVWTMGGTYVGTIEQIYKLPAQDVWEVKNGSAVHMIPAVKEFIRRIDIGRRRIDVHLIEGLIDGSGSSG